jgi:glycosyltransferase involved in cell wall biosynthesis
MTPTERAEAMDLRQPAGVPARPQVLILTNWYLPGYKAGGPIRTLSSLVERLGQEFDFKIITSDRDLGDTSPYAGLETRQWLPAGNATVLYVPHANPLTVLKAIRATPHEILYINGVFPRVFSMIPMWAYAAGLLPRSSVILAPHGEFSKGALSLKPRKKRAYLAVARRLAAYRRVVWHASSELEAKDILRTLHRGAFHGEARCEAGGRCDDAELSVMTALDLSPSIDPARNSAQAHPGKAQGGLRAVFLSRIARVKNLDGSLRLLDGLRGRVALDIYGPIEDRGYWRECEEQISALPPNITVQYCGVVPPQEVQSVLSGYDLFILPTLGENYGHAISDALVAGCPVLISDRTPWRGLEPRKVGWDLPLEQPELMREALQRCIEMPPQEHSGLCCRARAFGLDRAQDPEVVAQNRALLRFALQRSSASRGVLGPHGEGVHA